MEKVDIEARVERAKELFKSGYNCSQSVAMSYADLFDIDDRAIAILSGSFGGGLGRMREVCGAVSGMGIIASMMHPELSNPSNKGVKIENYDTVKMLAERYRDRCGSIICRELLGLDKATPTKKIPCADLVAIATRIVGEHINHKAE